MKINLIGKAANLSWGCEPMIQRGFEALGHQVTFANLRDEDLWPLPPADLNVVSQGYGLSMAAIHQLRDMTGAPVACWHAEVLSPEWPTMDEVVLAKAAQLSRNAAAYDVVVHNCVCCLSTVAALGAKRVTWCSSSGVDATVHRRLEVDKEIDIGIYGWASARRLRWVQETLACLPRGLRWAWPDAAEDQCYGERLVQYLNRCKVILNCHYSDTKNVETRLYEALGCGVPVVSEPLSMPDRFPEGQGVLYGDLPETLAAQIEAILDLPVPAYADFAATGYRLVHQQYSYQTQCAQFLDVVAKALA